MGYSFLEFMKKMGIFIICAQSFIHFAAGKSYEKYIKLLIGVMILAQFMVPVRTLFLKGETAEIWEDVERFQAEMEQALAHTQISGEDENETVKLLEGEIRSKLEETAKEYGYQVESVRIYEEPPKILITLTVRKTGNVKIKVNQINVENDRNSDVAEKEIMVTEEKNVQASMKEKFGVILGIDESYLEIHIS